MHQYNFLNFASTGPFHIQMGVFVPIFALLLIWTIVWKGLALWRAAKNNHTGWFVALLIINTLGILEIIYLYTVGKKRS
jgi:hypothetical protein